MNENRVLTLDEVMGIPGGEKVWFEAKEGTNRTSGVYRAMSGVKALICLEDKDEFVILSTVFRNVLDKCGRVWSLPQPPTPGEIAANPWREDA